MIFVNGTVTDGPELPMDVSLHCVTYMDSSKAILVGGFQAGSQGGDSASDRTFVYDFIFRNWTSGPDLNVGRNDHGCATFYSEFHQSLVVATVGGFNDGLLNSTELYKIESEKPEWIEG